MATTEERRPIIAITCYQAPARWGFWNLPAALVPLGYVEAVSASGGRPVLLPPVLDGIEETLALADGLIFAGGPDIEPARYDAPAAEESAPLSPERDAAELALLTAALGADLPVLGICRGMQLLNVAYGGSLAQHLPDVVGHDGHRTQPGAFDLHAVDIDPASRVGSILGSHAVVSSGHHQGIEAVGAGLQATAWAEDGSVEAVEDGARTFVIGVLWHPEEGEDRRLFAELVRAAGRSARDRAPGAIA